MSANELLYRSKSPLLASCVLGVLRRLVIDQTPFASLPDAVFDRPGFQTLSVRLSIESPDLSPDFLHGLNFTGFVEHSRSDAMTCAVRADLRFRSLWTVPFVQINNTTLQADGVFDVTADRGAIKLKFECGVYFLLVRGLNATEDDCHQLVLPDDLFAPVRMRVRVPHFSYFTIENLVKGVLEDFCKPGGLTRDGLQLTSVRTTIDFGIGPFNSEESSSDPTVAPFEEFDAGERFAFALVCPDGAVAVADVYNVL